MIFPLPGVYMSKKVCYSISVEFFEFTQNDRLLTVE